MFDALSERVITLMEYLFILNVQPKIIADVGWPG
jgi:hypothetical protein